MACIGCSALGLLQMADLRPRQSWVPQLDPDVGCTGRRSAFQVSTSCCKLQLYVHGANKSSRTEQQHALSAVSVNANSPPALKLCNANEAATQVIARSNALQHTSAIICTCR